MNEGVLMTRAELRRKLKALGPLDKDTRNTVTCALIGHSGIHTGCMGYFYCGRCGTQVGDSLMGSYNGKDTVIIEHDCSTCRKNYEKLTWRDKLYVPDPFKLEN